MASGSPIGVLHFGQNLVDLGAGILQLRAKSSERRKEVQRI
jgi:hypothetical protein